MLPTALSSVAVRHSPRPPGWARALRRPPRPPAQLLFGLALTAVLTAIGLRAGGGLSPSPTTKVEIALDLAGGVLGALAILAASERRFWGGATLVAFALLALLCAVSITWAVQPSDAWLETNRTVAYVAVLGAGIALARLAGDWWRALLGALLASATLISTWALLSKIFPGAFAADEVYARLREPYDYWNAVGLTAAMGVIPALWLGARRHGHGAISALAYPITGVLIVTLMLAYSRGALLALALGCATWFLLVPLRLRGAAVLAAGATGGLLVTAWAFSKDTLTTDRVPLDARITAGRELGIAVLAMVIVLLAVGLAAGFAAARRAPSPTVRRRAGGTILTALGLVPVIAVVALALSDKGLSGSVSSAWKSLTDPNDKTQVSNDPSRLTKVGSVRAKYWNESYKIFATSPWKGAGAGGYATARARFRQDSLAVRHAHGYVAQTGADLGVAGLTVSLILLVAWLGAAGRTVGLRALPAALRRRLPGRLGAVPPPRPWTAERVALATLFALVVSFGVHSTVDWTWYVPGTVVPALLAAGWLAGRGPSNEQPARPEGTWAALRAGARSPWRVGAAALAAAFALAAAWSAWQPLRSINAGNEALAALGEGAKGRDRALELAREARDRNPLSVDPLFELAAIESAAGRRDEAREALEDAVRLQPSNPATWLRLAEFELTSDPQRALRLLKAALHLDPHSPTGTRAYLEARRILLARAQAAADRRAAQRGGAAGRAMRQQGERRP